MEDIKNIRKTEEGFVAEIVTERVMTEEEVEQAKNRYTELSIKSKDLIKELSELEYELSKFEAFIEEELEEESEDEVNVEDAPSY